MTLKDYLLTAEKDGRLFVGGKEGNCFFAIGKPEEVLDELPELYGEEIQRMFSRIEKTEEEIQKLKKALQAAKKSLERQQKRLEASIPYADCEVVAEYDRLQKGSDECGTVLLISPCFMSGAY